MKRLHAVVHNMIIHPLMVLMPFDIGRKMHDAHAKWAWGDSSVEENAIEEVAQRLEGHLHSMSPLKGFIETLEEILEGTPPSVKKEVAAKLVVREYSRITWSKL